MLEKIDKEKITDIRELMNITVDKINEIIDYINKENSGDEDFKGLIDLLFPYKN